MKAVEANRDSFFGPIYLSIFFAITIAKRTSPAIESSVNRILGNIAETSHHFGPYFCHTSGTERDYTSVISRRRSNGQSKASDSLKIAEEGCESRVPLFRDSRHFRSHCEKTHVKTSVLHS